MQNFMRTTISRIGREEMLTDDQTRGNAKPLPLTQRVTRREFVAGIVAVGIFSLGPKDAMAAFSQPRAAPRPVRFDVIRAGDVIGKHDVDFKLKGGGLTVRTTIDITVRILGLTVFEFQHEGTELWRGGLLQAFDSQTHDDDSDFFVVGRAGAGGFSITNRKGTLTAPADIMVGSYWTSEIARRPQLIDPQRGRVKDQQILGTDAFSVPVDGRAVETTRYRVNGVTDGWVAYDTTGAWVAAELNKKGSDILYRVRA
jgi:Domain of unknown function (DUF6134)